MADELSKKLDPARHTLTLIGSRDFYMHIPARMRMMVSPLDYLENSALMPYTHLFDRVGKYKQGAVTQVKKKADGKSGTVVLASGEELPWDVLLLCPGNVWEGAIKLPDKKEEVHDFLDGWRKKSEKADKVVLVGGGAVGYELAGELRMVYPVSLSILSHN